MSNFKCNFKCNSECNLNGTFDFGRDASVAFGTEQNRFRWGIVVALVLAVSSTTACETTGSPAENEPPVARLLIPQLWPLEEAAPFDASSSFDFDGDLTRITMNFGDGTPEISLLDGLFEHVYPGPGSFEVRLEVEDDAGARAESLGAIVIAERVDSPLCSCDVACFDDAACDRESRRCFVGVQSADESEIGPPPRPAVALECGGESP